MGWRDWGAAEKMANERLKWRSLCLALSYAYVPQEMKRVGR